MSAFRRAMSGDAGLTAVLDPVDQDHLWLLDDELAAIARRRRAGEGSEEKGRSSKGGSERSAAVQSCSEGG